MSSKNTSTESILEKLNIKSLNEMQVAAQQGADVADATIQTQIETNVMDRLVNTILLLQAAKTKGIEITEEAVTAEYGLVAGQFQDAATFEAAIAEQGLTEELLRAELDDRLLLNAFITSDAFEQPSVSREEIQATYDQIVGTQPDLPPLEEVATEIEAQLAAQKQQTVIGSYIETLRSESDIEIRI